LGRHRQRPHKKVITFGQIEQTPTAAIADTNDARSKAHADLECSTKLRTSFFPPTACKDTSMAHQLRIYRGPCEESVAKPAASTAKHSSQISVSVSEVLPLLADAVASQRTWLKDFKDDEITISADLYEVLLAYQYFRRPSA
jgi:hypothetical protein